MTWKFEVTASLFDAIPGTAQSIVSPRIVNTTGNTGDGLSTQHFPAPERRIAKSSSGVS
jgi:hypothetical protein